MLNCELAKLYLFDVEYSMVNNVFKMFSLLMSMAPLNKETPLLSSPKLPHIGPPIPEVNSVWFKLYLYHKSCYGPPSLLLVRGK